MYRSLLFLPGNNPNMLINGNCLGADAVIFDLEDAVSPNERMLPAFWSVIRCVIWTMVMAQIAELGIRDITINASSMFDVHRPLLSHIQNSVVTGLCADYISSGLGREISRGILERPVQFRTHGGRPKDIDVLVTQGGIAVNPARTDLRDRLMAAKLPVLDIHELKDKIQGITGKPKSLVKGDRVVAEVIGRDGDLLDRIYSVR